MADEVEDKKEKKVNDSKDNQGLSTEQLTKAIDSLVKEYGSTQGALAQLYREKYEMRVEKRDLEQTISTQESTINNLQGELTEWNKLGNREEVKEAVEKYPDLVKKVEEQETTDRLTRLATNANYEPSVFVDLFKNREVTEEGEKVWVVEGENKTELDEFIQKNLTHYLPALNPTEVRTYPKQVKNTGGKTATKAGEYVQSKYGDSIPDFK